MIIRVFQNPNDYEEFSFEAMTLKEVLSGLKMLKGEEFTDHIISTKCNYILQEEEDSKALILNEDTVMSTFEGCSILYIVPNIEGEEPFSIGTAIWAATMTALTEAGVAAGMAAFLAEAAVAVASSLVSMGISMALNGIMQAISPTTEFSSDPAQAQQFQSSLFNGAPLIKEQGGSVPLWYGSSYCGGVLVSSSISSTEG